MLVGQDTLYQLDTGLVAGRETGGHQPIPSPGPACAISVSSSRVSGHCGQVTTFSSAAAGTRAPSTVLVTAPATRGQVVNASILVVISGGWTAGGGQH